MLQNAEHTLKQWAELWSSHNTDALLSLFTEDCVYEDVTFGLVNHGKAELRVRKWVFCREPRRAENR